MPAAPDPQEALRRRLKAARALAGLTVEKLAEHISQPGYGAKTLYAMESDQGREILPKDFGTLAAACDLPREFFTVNDFREALAGEPAKPDELAAINRRLTAAHDRIDDLADTVLSLQALATERLLTDAATATAQAEDSRAHGEPGRPRPTAEGSPR